MLEDVLRANAAFLAASGSESGQLAPIPQKRVAVITCVDCRLTGMIERAMGLSRGDAVTIRVAGNTIANDEVFRSLAVAIYALQVDSILVVGHTDCGFSKIDVFKFTEAMRKAGVSREAIDHVSIRDWLGAFSSIEANVRATVDSIRTCPLIPGGVSVAGFIIDSDSGSLQAVADAAGLTDANPVQAAPGEPLED